MNSKSRIRAALVITSLACAAWQTVEAEQPPRLPSRIGQHKTLLAGSRNPRINSLVSQGPVDDVMRVAGITIRFRPTAAQAAELEQLLDELQDPSSRRYHDWLAPDEYANRFGLNTADVTRVAEWLSSSGFRIDTLSDSRTYVSFSGSAAEVRRVFGTELHHFDINGRTHFANVRDVELPVELAPLVYSIQGLDDFNPEPSARSNPRPAASFNGGHAVTPGDLAVIYNVAPIYKRGINGAGQRVVVTGQSALNLQDIRDFRVAAGLPANEPKLVLMPGVRDAGYTNAAGEALLDVEYVGGAAPGATIIYVYGNNANLAAQYAIDQNLAPVISHSFGLCEKRDNNWAWYRNLAQQAAAQGITWVSSSGDTGPASCENQNRDFVGVSGMVVNLPAGVPEVTAVGGTTFSEGSGNYWSPNPKEDGTSALSYIPEKAWNDTRTGSFLSATGGGASMAYARPTWQSGVGVPNDNVRHVPDIAFTASGEHDPYLIIQTGSIVETGGTSAGTPFFAGALALLNQYVVNNGVQAKPGLGNINPRLYQLAQTTRGVFHDVTAGNNVVPCQRGSVDCFNGQYGYNAGVGYDQATGLGSMDIANFIDNWSASKGTPKKNAVVTASVSPTPVYQQNADADGFSWFYTVHVAETAGAAATITSFSIDGYDLSDSIASWFGSSQLPAKGGLSAELRSRDLDVPSDHIFAFAGVDVGGQRWSKQISVPFLGPKSSQKAAISMASDPAVVVKIGNGDPNCAADHPYYQVITLKELGGFSVQLTKFLAGGFDYTAQIAAWFGSQKLPAFGELHAGICWQLNTVPVTLSYEIDGVDNAGHPVQATLAVQFKSLLDQKSGSVDRGPSPAAAEPALNNVRVPIEPTGAMTLVPRHFNWPGNPVHK